MINDLTTLARVKAYLGVKLDAPDDPARDALLQQFITRTSAACLGDMGRDTLLVKAYTDMLDGTGSRAMMLSRWPVIVLSSVNVNGVGIQTNPTPPMGAGWTYDLWDGIPPGEPSRIILSGFCFSRGLANVSFGYKAGYGIVGEAASVPDDPGPYTITPGQPYGIISSDNGVTYADGTALTPVKTAPALGQYIPPYPLPVGPNDTSTITTDYTFSSEDALADVLLAYSFIPDAVEGAVCQWVAELWSYKDRIGQRSKSLGGQETISYIVNEIPAWVKLAIQPYRNVVPLQ